MKPITAQDIRDCCFALTIKHGQTGMESALKIPDYDYVCISEQGLRNFGDRFAQFLFDTGLNRYAEERNDCDDYALHAASFAKLDHARFHLGEEALAFGIAWITTDTLIHAVNAVVHLDNLDRPYLKLCESQITWNDRKVLGKPYVTMREFPLSSVRSWQLLCF